MIPLSDALPESILCWLVRLLPLPRTLTRSAPEPHPGLGISYRCQHSDYFTYVFPIIARMSTLRIAEPEVRIVLSVADNTVWRIAKRPSERRLECEGAVPRCSHRASFSRNRVALHLWPDLDIGAARGPSHALAVMAVALLFRVIGRERTVSRGAPARHIGRDARAIRLPVDG